MAAASDRVVTVFGGTGFLGRRIVRHLRLQGFCVRVASRHPNRQMRLRPDDPQVQSITADIHDARSVAAALADAYGVVNAVSLYVEHGRETLHSVHVKSAQRVAAQARRAGVKRLIHVSGIGADPRSQSLYIRKRGEGELAVREAFADVVLIRPAVMVGPDDAFLTTILKLLKRLPIYPMFGDGQMRLQPVYVEDVGQAITKTLHRPQTSPTVFECVGPRVYSYEELLRIVASAAGLKLILLPVPFAAWHALAWVAETLPSPPITRNQVELMEIDSTPSPGIPGLRELGISPHSTEDILQEILWSHGLEKTKVRDGP
jgi:NADH dehydrogenase